MSIGEYPDYLEEELAITNARLREYEEALSRLIRGDFGFVGHVDACRVQVGGNCTCGFSDVRRLNIRESPKAKRRPS